VTREEVEAIDWLRPDYLVDGELNMVAHSLLVQTPVHRIIVDAGVGNGKQRLMPLFDHLQTDFLERFERVWSRDEVDGVICTHLHLDHVGGGTVFDSGRWQPTFPNARYYFVREEYEHWRAFAADPDAPKAYSEAAYTGIDAVAVFEDSLRPVEEAGLITWVEPGQTVVPGISLISTAGHTPGHVAVLIEDAGESAVVTGDLLHAAMQIARPDWSPDFDTDPQAAAKTRSAFIERFADSPTLVLGTHFGTPTGNRIVRDGQSHKLVPVHG
jgi:glyoxylase-like metal-dependent hydrolase (beta-lactamase superfamily II)